MNYLPQEDGENESTELVVQKTVVSPCDHTDPPNAFYQFISDLRVAIGFKPLYLAERWSEAKVKKEENEAEAVRLAAVAQYQLVMAQVRKMDAETDNLHAHTDAVVAQTQQQHSINSLAAKLFAAKDMSPEEAMSEVENVVRRIEMEGGVVEFDLKELLEDSDDTEPTRE